MNYVDAGYASALGVLFLYGLALVMRRRRWERALKASDADRGGTSPAPGAPS
jgi:hypothetical protein